MQIEIDIPNSIKRKLENTTTKEEEEKNYISVAVCCQLSDKLYNDFVWIRFKCFALPFLLTKLYL